MIVWLSDVMPGLPMQNRPNTCLRESEGTSQLVLRGSSCGIKGAYLTDLILGDFVVAVAFTRADAVTLAPFRDHIFGIGVPVANEEMVGITAEPIITTVKHAVLRVIGVKFHAVRDLVRNAMRKIVRPSDPDLSVAAVRACGPRPARIGASGRVDMREQSIAYGFRSHAATLSPDTDTLFSAVIA